MIGYHRVTAGHMWVTIGYLSFLFLFPLSKHKANTTELHLKVRPLFKLWMTALMCYFVFRTPRWGSSQPAANVCIVVIS